ncbi:MAG: acetyl-CoA C-acyltransferase [Phycisphaerae bacterium]|nr:acetyl-CoA C-acyltransferase [Phycisphaerae bacterium]MAH66412.1 acetyl-CoA C-acyltransferase [Phycisphaerae bacterium]OUX01240.1 MAG: acetyl-CoA acetyltransferase [Phycisphaeraceae bacterium TMED231]OUX01531.1 MAG: acetyl-CoA acetyltransferase [Phycisphaeraceae bacterium TMED231]
MSDAHTPVIIAARRTPIGRFLGGFGRVPAPDLGAVAIGGVMNDAGLDPAAVEEVFMGCVLQAGVGQNPARQAALKAGIPDTVTAVTVNKVCGSGLEAVMQAARAIKAGDIEVAIAGGMENMDLAPHFANVRGGVKYGPATMQDHMAHDGLTCAFEKWPMGNAAEWIADEYDISRDEQDRFSAQSHNRAEAAWEAGHFEAEVLPMSAEQCNARAGVEKDEGFRPGSSSDSLAKLRPAFTKDGSVTAGNASQISAGAAAVVVMSLAKAKELGLSPIATIVDYNTAGVEPKKLFFAPAVGIEALLAKNDVKVDDIDLFEINEAFAAQVLADIKHLGVPEDKLNVCGGGIALGHPIGASGTRVLVTLLHQLGRTGGKRGVASLCLGGGNAVSMMVEMV